MIERKPEQRCAHRWKPEDRMDIRDSRIANDAAPSETPSPEVVGERTRRIREQQAGLAGVARDDLAALAERGIAAGRVGYAGCAKTGIDAFAFLDAAIDAGRGPVTFGMTDKGDVGVWIFDESDDAMAHGSGDTAEEALLDAAPRFPAILAAAKERP